MVRLARVARASEVCPCCLQAVVTTHVWRCDRCNATHHADCAVAHGSCAVVTCFTSQEEVVRMERSRSSLAGALGAFGSLAAFAALCATAALLHV